MKIAIIGGGFTGLTAAYELAKKGHKITIFEKEKELGGLAHGYRRPGWDWHLESAYHHLFTNDKAILGLIKELGLADKLIVKRPITANYIPPSVIARSLRRSNLVLDEIATPSERSRDDNGTIVQLDSPLHLLAYPGLSLADKLRTGALLASIKLNPFWQPFEWITAKKLFLTIGGRRAWETIWEPLMIGKFGSYADSVAASWLWARIKKRTLKLCYIEGGFQTLVSALEKAIIQRGGTIKKNCKYDCKRIFKYNSFSHTPFDRILLTIPTPTTIPHLHAQVLILETKEQILKNTYWLNITDRTFPFLAVVAHTNMIDKKYYGGHHLTYFGNYLPDNHPYLSMTKEQFLKKFLPFIKRLNPSFLKSSVISHTSFLGLYAQPIHELHYSTRAPKLKTSIPGLYLANMDSIYPWDRGTNYAVELGIHAARAICHSRAGGNP
ncbi:MAG: FAD-dependent oxidoreductase [Patescibacteria group bacterium]